MVGEAVVEAGATVPELGVVEPARVPARSAAAGDGAEDSDKVEVGACWAIAGAVALAASKAVAEQIAAMVLCMRISRDGCC